MAAGAARGKQDRAVHRYSAGTTFAGPR
jgi:hypothetical protein